MCGSHPSGAQLTGGSYVVVEACIKTGAVLVVLLYMYHRKRLATSSSTYASSAASSAAATTLIFPFYYSLFFATAFVDVLTVVLSLSFGGQLPPAMAALCWALSRLITEGLAIFLLHHGVDLATIQYSFTYAVMWALVSFIAWYCVPILREDEQTNVVGDVLALVYLTPPFLAYVLLAFAPMKHLPRRPAVLPIALLMSAVFATLVIREALLVGQSFLPGPCVLWTAWSLLLWACFPFVVYHALVIDSQWWQGLYHDPRGWAGNLNTPLLDVWGEGLLEAPASELASLMYQLETAGGGTSRGGCSAPTTLPVTSSSSSSTAVESSVTPPQERVPIIPFGQLQLRTDLKYRSGSNSRVYVAAWKAKVVAVKMLFAMELDAAILREFFQEARVLYSLRRHPNMLHCLGVAIMPPAACLVTELCEHGSLFEFLKRFKQQQQQSSRERRGRGGAAAASTWQQSGAEHSSNSSSRGGHAHLATPPAPTESDLASEEMGTFSRDGNDEEGDDSDHEEEEAAAQRRLMARQCEHDLQPPLALPYTRRLQLMVDCAAGVCHLHAQGLVHGDIKSLNFLVTAALTVKLGDVGECRHAGAAPAGGGPVHPSTINWAPPEVLAGAVTHYHPSMDVYSLGLVLHEVLTLQVPFHHEPYASLRTQELVQHIVAGNRPSLAWAGGGATEETGGACPIPSELQALVGQCWHADPGARPPATEVHARLLALLEASTGKEEEEVEEVEVGVGVEEGKNERRKGDTPTNCGEGAT